MQRRRRKTSVHNEDELDKYFEEKQKEKDSEALKKRPQTLLEKVIEDPRYGLGFINFNAIPTKQPLSLPHSGRQFGRFLE